MANYAVRVRLHGSSLVCPRSGVHCCTATPIGKIIHTLSVGNAPPPRWLKSTQGCSPACEAGRGATERHHGRHHGISVQCAGCWPTAAGDWSRHHRYPGNYTARGSDGRSDRVCTRTAPIPATGSPDDSSRQPGSQGLHLPSHPTSSTAVTSDGRGSGRSAAGLDLTPSDAHKSPSGPASLTGALPGS